MGTRATEVIVKIGWLHGLPPAQRSILRALAHRYNDATGLCFPSIRKLAEEEGIGKGAIRHTIAKLLDAGRILRSTVFGRPGYLFPAAVEAVIKQYGIALRDGLHFDIRVAYAGEVEYAEARQYDAGGDQIDAQARQYDAGGGSYRRGGGIKQTRVTEVTTTNQKNPTTSINSLADTSPTIDLHEVDIQPPKPRPVLLQKDAITDPDTAKSVYNTLELAIGESDMLTPREMEIRTILYHGVENGHHLTRDRRYELRSEYSDIARQKRLQEEGSHDIRDEHAHTKGMPALQSASHFGRLPPAQPPLRRQE